MDGVQLPQGHWGSLLFITKFSEIPGTHFIDLRRMKAELTLVLNERPLDCGSSALTTGPLFIVILFAINTFT